MPPGDFNVDVLHARLTMLHENVDDVKAALRELTAAIAKLAVVEAAQAQAHISQERAWTEIKSVDQRVQAMEKLMPLMNKSNDWFERILFTGIGAAVSAAVLRFIGA